MGLHSRRRARAIAATFTSLALLAACASDDTSPAASAPGSDATPSAPAATQVATTEAPPADPPATDPPTTSEVTAAGPLGGEVRPGTEQIALLDAEPGAEITLVDASGAEVATGTVDVQGSLLFREVPAGDGYRLTSGTGADATASEPVHVAAPDEVPDAGFYADQPLLPVGGFGYITTRDGTTLSANVVLPGPADAGPYPTVVEYSGYQPSDPASASFAQIYTTMGFAYVGVNMRGTGCSGGSYRFFETVQGLDGYDVVEAVAAQPWVEGHRVGMVGVSYPGISQLFVAATQPPSLAAITPLSVLDDSYRSTLYPGGILNTGFAVEWTADRVAQAEPYGQEWTRTRADEGDDVCAANQALRLQNPDLLAEIEANPFYANPLGDSLAPVAFADRIAVPVFLAGAWQDEQTGGHFPALIPALTSAPHVYATLTNGLHTESILPGVFQRYAEFLQLYVAQETPDMTTVNQVAPIVGATITGVTDYPPYTDRFAGLAYADALARFEAEPPIVVNFEQGAADGLPAGAPLPRFSADFDAWPIEDATTTAWYLNDGGMLTAEAPAGAAPCDCSYVADPDAVPDVFWPDDAGTSIWQAAAPFDWAPLPPGSTLGYATAPLAEDVVVVGPGSVDLWIEVTKDGAPVGDTDLEVTISEIRPDGQEVYVQSGWLRASQRALDEEASTELRPVHTHAEADASPLPAEPTAVRVELFPFAHVFRAGSQLRLTIDAPGGSRAEWVFDTIADGETVTIDHSSIHPSRLVLAVVDDVVAPTGLPACGSLRGQPCRAYVPTDAGG